MKPNVGHQDKASKFRTVPLKAGWLESIHMCNMYIHYIVKGRRGEREEDIFLSGIDSQLFQGEVDE